MTSLMCSQEPGCSRLLRVNPRVAEVVPGVSNHRPVPQLELQAQNQLHLAAKAAARTVRKAEVVVLLRAQDWR